jgi:hypothetical protein
MKHDGTKSVRKSKQTRVHNSVMSKNLSVLAIFLQTSPVASRKNPLEIGFVASTKNPLQMRVKKWW